MTSFRIAPSILSADFAKLGEEVCSLVDSGADFIHFDVMDNHYVPNLSFGPMVCKALRPYSKIPIDVHLMIKPVDALIPLFAEAGANLISFHPEASEHIDRTLALIRDCGCKAGLAFNPATPVNCLEYLMDRLDIILLMSVNPGFGGQKFISCVLNKISTVREIINKHGKNIYLEVDGGISIENIRSVADAGADTFVAGSSIFSEKNYSVAINKMRKALSAENK